MCAVWATALHWCKERRSNVEYLKRQRPSRDRSRRYRVDDAVDGASCRCRCVSCHRLPPPRRLCVTQKKVGEKTAPFFVFTHPINLNIPYQSMLVCTDL